MTGLLRMEPERVQSCADTLNAQSEEIQRQAAALLASGYAVDWYGPSREIFQRELEQLVQELVWVAEEGQALSVRLRWAANQWQELDALYTQLFSQFSFISYPNSGDDQP